MKKKNLTLWVTAGLLCLLSNPLFAQCGGRRPNITSFTSAERIELRNLMMDYLRSEIDNSTFSNTSVYQYTKVGIHSNFGGSSANWHSYDERFLTWHRAYIAGMEQYILSRGGTKYIPLPDWKPTDKIPDEFFNDNGSDGIASVLPASHGFRPLERAGPFTSSVTDFSRFDDNLDC
ncbi:MAG: hypothetical protein ACI8ZO_001691 [Flavobacteriales bacterium]|jgi:hypothetical protein